MMFMEFKLDFTYSFSNFEEFVYLKLTLGVKVYKVKPYKVWIQIAQEW